MIQSCLLLYPVCMYCSVLCCVRSAIVHVSGHLCLFHIHFVALTWTAVCDKRVFGPKLSLIDLRMWMFFLTVSHFTVLFLQCSCFLACENERKPLLYAFPSGQWAVKPCAMYSLTLKNVLCHLMSKQNVARRVSHNYHI